MKQIKYFLGFLVLLFTFSTSTFAVWPDDNDWNDVLSGGGKLQDPLGDAAGSRNLVSDVNNAAALMENDGTTIYFRIRLDDDPSGSGGQGELQ
ncbi:hypothetical protein HOF92_04170 [bacterium]|jgi:hypothetical protein|nr:hypothetical protein [bacterium]